MCVNIYTSLVFKLYVCIYIYIYTYTYTLFVFMEDDNCDTVLVNNSGRQ